MRYACKRTASLDCSRPIWGKKNAKGGERGGKESVSEASEPKAIQKARGEKRRKGGDEAYFILTSPAIKTYEIHTTL